MGLMVYLALPRWEERGQFGDMFGTANALFAALAFAGVVYAILLQREELKLQRKELRLTRLQVAEQTKLHAQRLSMQEAALRPLLRFVRISSLRSHGENSFGKKTGQFSMEVVNDGGPMYHATGRLIYQIGLLPETPSDQDYDFEITTNIDDEGAGTENVTRGGTCHLIIYFSYLEGEIESIDLSCRAQLIFRYVNAMAQPRVSEYDLVLKSRKGRLFLMRDLEPTEAMNCGLLDDYPGSPLSWNFEGREVGLDDLYPELK